MVQLSVAKFSSLSTILTEIWIRFLAAYSTTAIIYSALLLHQQSTGQYLRGSAAFQLSWWVDAEDGADRPLWLTVTNS